MWLEKKNDKKESPAISVHGNIVYIIKVLHSCLISYQHVFLLLELPISQKDFLSLPVLLILSCDCFYAYFIHHFHPSIHLSYSVSDHFSAMQYSHPLLSQTYYNLKQLYFYPTYQSLVLSSCNDNHQPDAITLDSKTHIRSLESSRLVWQRFFSTLLSITQKLRPHGS